MSFISQQFTSVTVKLLLLLWTIYNLSTKILFRKKYQTKQRKNTGNEQTKNKNRTKLKYGKKEKEKHFCNHKQIQHAAWKMPEYRSVFFLAHIFRLKKLHIQMAKIDKNFLFMQWQKKLNLSYAEHHKKRSMIDVL